MKKHGCNKLVRYEELATLPLPEAKNRFVPLAHKDLIDRAFSTLDILGYTTDGHQFMTNQDGLKFMATFYVTHPDDEGNWITDDYRFKLGLINSNDGSMSAKAITGGDFMVCLNEWYTGNIVLNRKHTANAEGDINRGLRDLAFDLRNIRRKSFEEIEQLKEYDFSSKAEAHDFVVETCKRDILPWQHVPKVLEHWDTPEHDIFKPRNGCSMFNAYTSHWRDTNQFSLVSKTTKLRTFIDDFKKPELQHAGSTKPRPKEFRPSTWGFGNSFF